MSRLFVLVAAVVCLTAQHADCRARTRRQTDDSLWWMTTPGPVPAHRPLENAALSSGGGDPGSIAINDLADLASLFGGLQQDCECVPYYQCVNGEIVTDGKGLIDIRFGPTINNTDAGNLNSNSKCVEFLDVCCRHPDKTILPVPGPAVKYQAKCGRRNELGVNSRITGFTELQAQYGEFPWMAAVLKLERIDNEDVNLYVCGGSLIYPDVVLTAAHCVQSWQHTPGVLKVRLGEWDTQRKNELYEEADRRISKVVTHEDYNAGSLSNDYALLFLESPVELSPHIDTICLPDALSVIDGSDCFVTGWGKNEFGKKGNFQNILKKVNVPLVENSNCEYAMKTTRLGKHFDLHPTFICAGGEADGNDACKGDGGSPLVCPLLHDQSQYVQVGIVAWGIGCGQPGIPGVYADVTKGLDWIHKYVTTIPNSSG